METLTCLFSQNNFKGNLKTHFFYLHPQQVTAFIFLLLFYFIFASLRHA